MIVPLLLLTVIFPWLNKYSYIITNQFSQIPIIFSFIDKNYLLNDWYVNISRSFGPRTIFAWYMAQTAKLISLPLSFLLHYVLYIFFTSLASYRLSYLMFKNKLNSFATTICILFGSTITLGNNLLVTQDFVAPQLPLSFSLFAIVLLLEQRFFLSAIFFTLASYLHPLIGFESAVLFLCTYLVSLILRRKSLLKLIIQGIVPYLFFSLLAICLYFGEGTKSSISSSLKLAILVYMRNPHHYLASSFTIFSYVKFLTLLLIGLIILYSLRNKLSQVLSRFIFISCILIIFCYFVGFIFTEFYPLYFIAVLQPFRLTLYIYWFIITLTFSYIFYLINKNSHFSFLLLIPLFLTNLDYFSSISKVNTITIVLGFFLVLRYRSINRKVFLFLLVIFFVLCKYHDQVNISSYYLHHTNETNVAQWSKINTEQNAVFLVPPEFESFRLIANRAIVVDWKSFPFQEEAMLEWAQRICSIGNVGNCDYKRVTQKQVVEGYRSLNEEIIRNLSKKYQFQYLVTDVPCYSFTKLYQDRYYVYKL